MAPRGSQRKTRTELPGTQRTASTQAAFSWDSRAEMLGDREEPRAGDSSNLHTHTHTRVPRNQEVHSTKTSQSGTHGQAEFLKGRLDECDVLRQNLFKVPPSFTDVPQYCKRRENKIKEMAWQPACTCPWESRPWAPVTPQTTSWFLAWRD